VPAAPLPPAPARPGHLAHRVETDPATRRLVRRAPRVVRAGEVREGRTAPPAPGDDLFAALSRYTGNRYLSRPGTVGSLAGPFQAGGDRSTPSGLRRRVPGAQLPSTAPLAVRRGDAPAWGGAPTQAPAPARQPATVAAAGRPIEEARPADDVYRLLSSFTAGVRRGLHHAKHASRPPD
jgi:hypothetical protein